MNYGLKSIKFSVRYLDYEKYYKTNFFSQLIKRTPKPLAIGHLRTPIKLCLMYCLRGKGSSFIHSTIATLWNLLLMQDSMDKYKVHAILLIQIQTLFVQRWSLWSSPWEWYLEWTHRGFVKQGEWTLFPNPSLSPLAWTVVQFNVLCKRFLWRIEKRTGCLTQLLAAGVLWCKIVIFIYLVFILFKPKFCWLFWT